MNDLFGYSVTDSFEGQICESLLLRCLRTNENDWSQLIFNIPFHVVLSQSDQKPLSYNMNK